MSEGNEFAGFLVAGLLIIAILISAFSITPFATAKEPVRIPSITVLNRTAGIFVGPIEEDAFTPFSFSFDVNNRRDLNVIELGEMELSNGLLFEEKAFTYTLAESNLENVKIRFRVNRTNGLDALVVLLDGEKIGEARTAGDYEFDIQTTGPATIEMRALSSSWQMWAPNLYVLEDVEVEFYAFSEKNDIFRFTLDKEEAENFISGKIDFVMDENIGKIILTLNGIEMFNGPLNNIDTVQFGDRGIQEGPNVLLIRADTAARLKGNAVMTVFFSKQTERGAITLFALTDGEWTQLQTGEIRFIVPIILDNGGISVRIVHNNTLLFSDFSSLSEGLYVIEFDQRHARPGMNQLIIESVNSASFEVADISIRV